MDYLIQGLQAGQTEQGFGFENDACAGCLSASCAGPVPTATPRLRRRDIIELALRNERCRVNRPTRNIEG